MKIIEEGCKRTGPKAEIVVEGKNLEEVKSLDARNLVLDHARKMGLSVPGFTGGSWTEWYNEDGEVLQGEKFSEARVRLCRATYPVQEATL